MALHVVGNGQGIAFGREGTWHCMWWGGDLALHEVESQDTARAVFPGPYMGFRFTRVGPNRIWDFHIPFICRI